MRSLDRRPLLGGAARRAGCCVHACVGRRRPARALDPEGSSCDGLREVEAKGGFGRGSEASPCDEPLTGPAHPSKITARQRLTCRPIYGLRARWTSSSSYPWTGRVIHRRVSPTTHARVQDSAVAALPRRRCCSFAVGCPPTASPWSSAPHPHPSRDVTGQPSQADPRAPWPECVLTDLNTPRRSRRGGRPAQRPARIARGAPRCPHTVGTAPVSNISPLHLRRAHVVRMVEHSTDVITSTQGSPFVARGCSRAPGPKPWRRVTRRRSEDGRHDRHRVVTDAMGSASPA